MFACLEIDPVYASSLPPILQYGRETPSLEHKDFTNLGLCSCKTLRVNCRRTLSDPVRDILVFNPRQAESGTRKCLILFNWLSPLTSILAEHSATIYPQEGPLSKQVQPKKKPLLHTFLHASPPVLLELVQAFADDVATFSKLGLLGRRTGERAGRFADWCWFASTLVNLVENSVERSIIVTSRQTGMTSIILHS